jgi:glycerol-3-phosphate dehydrogenase
MVSSTKRMNNMIKTVETDIAIVGGGVTGLWLLNRLRQEGYSCILLEAGSLGGGQTHLSQGIIHGGTKYALQGTMTPAAQAISDMPGVWQHCLQGSGKLDLSAVPVLSSHQYLFSTNKIAAKLTGMFATMALNGKVEPLKAESYPEVFQHPGFKGSVYALQEMTIDVQALIRELVKPNQDVIFKIDPLREEQIKLDEEGNLVALEVSAASSEPVLIKARKYVFAAGKGNEIFLNKVDNKTQATQRRPLHMVVVKTDFTYPVFAHCLGMGSTPRITITTHQARDGKTVWYLGGQIAEEGVKYDQPAQIRLAKKELQEIFSWLDFSSASFASFFVDRAEPLQPGGKRPDSFHLEEIKNTLVVWPTKLALAPRLAEEIITTLKNSNAPVGLLDTRALRAFPMPALATPVWDELLC